MRSKQVQQDKRERRFSSASINLLQVAMWIQTPIMSSLNRQHQIYASGVAFCKTNDIRHLIAYTELVLWPRLVSYRYMLEVLEDAKRH